MSGDGDRFSLGLPHQNPSIGGKCCRKWDGFLTFCPHTGPHQRWGQLLSSKISAVSQDDPTSGSYAWVLVQFLPRMSQWFGNDLGEKMELPMTAETAESLSHWCLVFMTTYDCKYLCRGNAPTVSWDITLLQSWEKMWFQERVLEWKSCTAIMGKCLVPGKGSGVKILHCNHGKHFGSRKWFLSENLALQSWENFGFQEKVLEWKSCTAIMGFFGSRKGFWSENFALQSWENFWFQERVLE